MENLVHEQPRRIAGRFGGQGKVKDPRLTHDRDDLITAMAVLGFGAFAAIIVELLEMFFPHG